MRLLTLLLSIPVILFSAEKGLVVSRHAGADFALTADPDAKQWKDIPGVFADRGPQGQKPPVPPTEFRSRWTTKNIYFLFICPYRSLYLKSDPVTDRETNKLWDWDVAEVFIGTDPAHIRQYEEFEVSPQGEWVDLDIDRDSPKPAGGVNWDSGFQVKARIDEENKVWYAEMRIPMEALGIPKPKEGQEMRVNLYRIEGRPQDRLLVSWQPTGAPSFHVPEAFGKLRLGP
ncbi:MAG: carbohydrate-binding family 9-like protein [Acidobacteriota bacterium]|nr:carbohydrate-binding family 9-like protein [Acidobacteriota bacterium]